MGNKSVRVQWIFVIVVAGLLFANNHAYAECPVAGTRAVTMKTVADGDTFFTADNAEIDLDGVIALGSGGEKVSSAQNSAARDALSNTLKQGPISLAFAGQEKDRYGRLKTQVFIGKEWVQGELLRAGLARAAPELAGDACAHALLAVEAEARNAKRGHWSDGSFAVLAPEDLRGKTGTFQIVEGKVENAATQRGRVYLNFGADWRTDFTVTVSPDDMKRFREAHYNLRKLQGKRVRVRGWLESYYGPEMEIARPGAIENLEPSLSKENKKRKRKRPGSKAPGPSHSNR